MYLIDTRLRSNCLGGLRVISRQHDHPHPHFLQGFDNLEELQVSAHRQWQSDSSKDPIHCQIQDSFSLPWPFSRQAYLPELYLCPSN